ncbi:MULTISPECIES: flagellar hook-associated protein FlgK [Sphingomonas]|jgi:flagellar hook-associated protein 1 FlgK|uniref:Flagellar hook-associated protein 1 n=1 Tax=Sphingomonas taxi TaxID=1549858 RepID=A0A097EHL8_9SPHN|nr:MULTISPECIES: flagellar hook-associated protein FlgK [Sphingomonas]AIT07058.1 flagellar hook protein FlgK [Sphingomonas taxi]
MSDLLSIGASGVRAYQSALATVGENIANVNSPGYTRRTVNVAEVAGGSGSTNPYGAGNGVVMTGINRSSNVYASAALRASTSDLARTTGGADWLDRIQGALTGNALTSRVTSFFASAQSLAAEPNSTALRTGMMSAAASAGIAFTATGKAFDQVDADIDSAGNQAAQTLTSLGDSLAKINESISRAQLGSTAAAQLMDQRDNILSQMSGIADITSRTDAIGRATVSFAGSTGPAFVQGVNSGMISYDRDSNGKIAFSVTVGAVKNQIGATGGSIAGIVDGAERVAAIRQELDAVAKSFVGAVNDNQAAGLDQTGAQGVAMFTTGAKPTDVSISATFTGSQIAAGKIAAAQGGGVRDSSNLTALEATRVSKGFETSLTALVTDNATAYKQKNTIADAQAAIRDGATTALSTATGVNLDAEAVDLMRFQQAYAASGRVIQVARETMQTILDIR